LARNPEVLSFSGSRISPNHGKTVHELIFPHPEGCTLDSIWYGIAILALFIVIRWWIINDTVTNGETRGFLAMKPPNQEPAVNPRRRRAPFSVKNLN
jgi:hypothetical protein